MDTNKFLLNKISSTLRSAAAEEELVRIAAKKRAALIAADKIRANEILLAIKFRMGTQVSSIEVSPSKKVSER